GLIVLLSYFTYVHRYASPAAFFWDENYHIASAQKYLNGVYFMEQHPPLGKMLIALGEKIVNANQVDNQFINTDYGKDPPPGFSFAGYRLFPVLLAWLSVPILFGIFLLITRSTVLAALLSFLPTFDNALIVHMRGAMLEGPLTFFIALAILAFLLCLEWRARPRLFAGASILFGAAFGAAFVTKLTALILILLVPALFIRFRPQWRQFCTFAGLAFLSFFIVYCAIWHLHFATGKTINPSLPDNGYYQASQEYKSLLAQGQTDSLLAFPIMLRDSIRFVSHYNRGVPRLDLCKPDENGSPFFYWPLGARSINYRWETPDGQSYRYLYLQVNPIVWWSSALAIFLAVSLLVCSYLFPFKEKLKNPFLLLTFLALYTGYMLTLARLSRVMYLYHYFVPLLFSFVILALVVMELRSFGKHLFEERQRIILCFVLAFLVFAGYQFYRPFTYYEPITDTAFQRRALFPLWELTCVKCQKVSPVAVPRNCPNS
ncbi:MAG: phospholipid carrier-dependent glycosyltransferase, partial [Candidatus Peribacteraceae bacterium]|nr:phospholipid carrier-dependent glycosyltransferase [Candidatus Peribacteraceae bacterium]